MLAGSAGNLVEWYDWYVYSAFSLYFAPKFFPSNDRTAELLGAAAVFAVGFLMRPIGAWLMGIYADRRGRRAALTLSVLLMCGGSMMIACTPSHASIGVAAPVLLVLARLLQGLSVGGEYGASATYLSELATPSRRGFWSSLQYVTLIAGQLVALSVLIVLQAVLDRAAVANTIFGGTAEYVALWFKARGMERGFYVYVTLAITASLVVYASMRDTRGRSRIYEDASA